MKSFHTTQKLSCLLLGMGVMVSAHATHVSCGDEFSTDFEVVTLDEDVALCGAADAVLISGNNIQFMLNGHSISSSTGDNRGIRITGNDNQVMGPGTVTGFSRNVDIFNGNDNHVSKLNITLGTDGVIIRTDGAFSTADRNYISDNVIDNIDERGVYLQALGAGSVSENRVHHNDIQDIDTEFSSSSYGILVQSSAASVADNNRIHHNNIENVRSDTLSRGIAMSSGGASSSTSNNFVQRNTIKVVRDLVGSNADGILVNSSDTGSANNNQISSNEIEDTDRYGIQVRSEDVDSNANINHFFFNTITRPGAEAIALDPEALAGFGFLNSVTWNFSNEVTGQAYCDSSSELNNWGLNFDDLSPLTFDPGPCV